jgi:hypothetical protein
MVDSQDQTGESSFSPGSRAAICRPVTARTWREMSWPERWRWMRATG